MKILNQTVVLAITVLLNCGELYASGEGPSSPYDGQTSHRHSDQNPQPHLSQHHHLATEEYSNLTIPHSPFPRPYSSLPGDPPPTYTINYLNRVIGVWQNHQNVYHVQLLGPNIYPDKDYKKDNNYITRGIFGKDFEIFVYINANNEVIGAKLPPDTADRLKLYQVRFYITYFGEIFNVAVKRKTGEVLSIKRNKGQHIPPTDPIYRERHGIEEVSGYFGGIHFYVSIEKKPAFKVWGAYLNTSVASNDLTRPPNAEREYNN